MPEANSAALVEGHRFRLGNDFSHAAEEFGKGTASAVLLKPALKR